MESVLSFSTADLALTRFAVSPMWEVVTSFRLLRSEVDPPLHRRWAAQVRPRLIRAGLDRGWLAELIPLNGYLADFLNPTPATPFPAISVELAAIRETTAEQVRTELDMLAADRAGSARRDGAQPGGSAWSARSRLLYDAPEETLAKVAAEIEAYWELALAPYWARVRQLLDADVFYRARQAAEHGSAHVLDELHDSVRWDDGTLRLVRRHCSITRGQAGGGLLLVPSAFVWPRVLTRSVAGEPPQLAYPARGVGNLWEPRTPTSAAAVAGVLGRSRTRILTELDTPSSTTQLARRAGMSAAGISQHLTALRDAGLVTAHRSGRSVLYARTSVADALLTPAGD
ncbi:DUF5937 family protein [Actinopolymorpha sp. NPDC004070]|uniref:ArsR/SmtB family transcription factor n=1 Tax=Actinopolymorpha sp. NPDC004070 TaxID=3154548 RepID=UPI0033A601F3